MSGGSLPWKNRKMAQFSKACIVFILWYIQSNIPFLTQKELAEQSYKPAEEPVHLIFLWGS